MLCRHEQAILKALNFQAQLAGASLGFFRPKPCVQVGYPCLEQWFYVLNCRMKLLSGGSF